MENIDPRTKIGNYFQQKILKYEIIILLLIVLLVGFKLFHLIQLGPILTLVLTSVAVVYFFSAFATPNENETSAFDIFIKKLISLGSSVALIGILFIAQNWPMGDTMITVGLLTLGMCLIYYIYQKLNSQDTAKYDQIIIIRLIVLLIISAGIYYINKK
jgi:hypothetical protein